MSRTLTHTTLQRASGQQAGVYLFANGVLMFTPLGEAEAYALMKREVQSGFKHLAHHAKDLLPSKRLTPKEDFITPLLGANGVWSYGFGNLEVGGQMRCPIGKEETHEKAQIRCISAFCSWTKRSPSETYRKTCKCATTAYGTYILLERIA